ncbi:Aldolase-type TIM barrel [Moorella glycerini]|uniref:Glutamate synthase [NADPH] large chain n=1 Tax=Neomoorella stamsii TaxID=1266720 RepID=A0A9X7J5J8_9FIRM|nr:MULTISPECIES: FMN-binding glutamate synthase family protein [Moorella]PRR76442.1 Glutamate synthase [NADPH] large chain [Moorella stamsii]CEP66989.1 Aldolase-type TIM barrel [Moorella glycerini]
MGNRKAGTTVIWKMALGSAGLTCLGLWLFSRPLLNRIHDSFLKTVMTDPYEENFWEFVSASTRTGLQKIVETNLRAQQGQLIQRPFGSPWRFPGTDGLVFNLAQLAKLPVEESVPVNTKVTLGPQAARPLKISMPIIVSGMAYGLALSEKAKIALARGASLAGTATNTGEGPFLPSERQAARHLIVQYNRGGWNHNPRILKQADMVEIQFGQAARGGLGHSINYDEIPPKGRHLLGLKPGQAAVTHARMPGIKDPQKDLPPLVTRLRHLTGGVPIGAKIGAGNDLEKDLAILLEAGVDFIAIDGAGAATKGSPPIVQDDFGVPTVYAVNRAATFLKKHGVKDKVSLIAGGGLVTPGDFLKILALGANAVYIGTIALFALTHTQVLKAMPWEPPVQVVFAQGRYQDQLDVDKAAHNLANFLRACNAEIMAGVRALGKKSVRQVNKTDLAALDPVTARALGIPLATRARSGFLS